MLKSERRRREESQSKRLLRKISKPGISTKVVSLYSTREARQKLLASCSLVKEEHLHKTAGEQPSLLDL